MCRKNNDSIGVVPSEMRRELGIAAGSHQAYGIRTPNLPGNDSTQFSVSVLVRTGGESFLLSFCFLLHPSRERGSNCALRSTTKPWTILISYIHPKKLLS